MNRWRRPRRRLVRGVPLLVASTDDDGEYAAFQRRLDDMSWTERLARPFRWQTWIDWFAARRWIRPDADIDPTHLAPIMTSPAPNFDKPRRA